MAKWLLVLVLLGGCATVPEGLDFRFACREDGTLLAGATFDNLDGIWVAEVGRCLGDLKIIGQQKGTGV